VDLSDELEEADFFLQQGLRDEARDALEALRDRHPGHPEIAKRLAALGGAARPAAPATPRPAGRTPPPGLGAPRESPRLVTAGGDESFDIARELAEELDGGAGPPAIDDDFQYSVEDVFNQFKKGVAETVRPEDSATHYDLGIAYKEMGLVDDAIHEFETAMRDRRREVDCLSMIGLCRMAQGQPREAIQVFRRALGSDYLGKDAAKAIHFELATAYEAAGEPEIALFVFHKVAKVDPAYRDVGERIDALGGGPGRPPADEPRAARPPGSRTTIPAPRVGTPGAAVPTAGQKKNIGYL
jgi:tetratricopeptide (TPR) repeat protein